jgi:hypothetical protein
MAGDLSDPMHANAISLTTARPSSQRSAAFYPYYGMSGHKFLPPAHDRRRPPVLITPSRDRRLARARNLIGWLWFWGMVPTIGPASRAQSMATATPTPGMSVSSSPDLRRGRWGSLAVPPQRLTQWLASSRDLTISTAYQLRYWQNSDTPLPPRRKSPSQLHGQHLHRPTSPKHPTMRSPITKWPGDSAQAVEGHSNSARCWRLRQRAARDSSLQAVQLDPTREAQK